MNVLKFENNKITYLNQSKLPLNEEYITTDNYEIIAQAIEKLEIRGAPLIGIAAAYAVFLGVKSDGKDKFDKIYNRLAATRPTAVNLFWALNIMKNTFNYYKDTNFLLEKLLNKAIEIHNNDKDMCLKIAYNGLEIFKKKSNILTHCNAGELATGGIGTALGIIKKSFEHGLINLVYVDETRPLLQGSRLTAFELEKYNIPFKIICDNMAAKLMKDGCIDLVLTGADRIATNGDSANKIGTYGLAVLSKFHNIPFYIAAPSSTIDTKIPNGNDILIEERNSSEITSLFNLYQITKSNYDVYNPSFDITPANLITAIITEKKLYHYPFNFDEKNI